jgi:hypothetical protein
LDPCPGGPRVEGETSPKHLERCIQGRQRSRWRPVCLRLVVHEALSSALATGGSGWSGEPVGASGIEPSLHTISSPGPISAMPDSVMRTTNVSGSSRRSCEPAARVVAVNPAPRGTRTRRPNRARSKAYGVAPVRARLSVAVRPGWVPSHERPHRGAVPDQVGSRAGVALCETGDFELGGAGVCGGTRSATRGVSCRSLGGQALPPRPG